MLEVKLSQSPILTGIIATNNIVYGSLVVYAAVFDLRVILKLNNVCTI